MGVVSPVVKCEGCDYYFCGECSNIISCFECGEYFCEECNKQHTLICGICEDYFCKYDEAYCSNCQFTGCEHCVLEEKCCERCE